MLEAVVMPGGASSPRRELDAWQDWAKARGAKGLAYILVNEDGTLGGPVSKNISEKETKLESLQQLEQNLEMQSSSLQAIDHHLSSASRRSSFRNWQAMQSDC